MEDIEDVFWINEEKMSETVIPRMVGSNQAFHSIYILFNINMIKNAYNP